MKTFVAASLCMCLVAAISAFAAERYTAAWPHTDFTRTAVPLSEVISGGPGKDGIPSIDDPKFVEPADAVSWIDADEPVVLLASASSARLYPLQLLTFHEIVNDTFEGRPVAVTFCPLCNASIVFDRRVDDRVLAFGTTGLLRHSDLVMYDRTTESWWQQFTGEAIVGEMTGRTLDVVPSSIVSFREATAAYPDARVLSRDTGFSRPYGQNPYPGYDRVGQRPFLFRGETDGRLPAMARVLGVERNGDVRVFPHDELVKTPVVNDDVGDTPVLVVALDHSRSALDDQRIAASRKVLNARAFVRRHDNVTLHFNRRGNRLVDEETGSEWSALGEAVEGPLAGARLELIEGGSHFAFAWLAFKPDSDIYRAPP